MHVGSRSIFVSTIRTSTFIQADNFLASWNDYLLTKDFARWLAPGAHAFLKSASSYICIRAFFR